MITQAISRKNRIRKYNLFLEKMKPSAMDKILDVGYANKEYSPVDNFLEKSYPYPSNITALGIEACDLFKQHYPNIEVVRYDGKIFPFEDKQFDIGWSNAVIEHVGNEECQIQFVKELCRTCKKVYFTTPNRYFPFEVHTRIPFLHWSPKKVFDKILSVTSKKWAAGDYMNLLSRKSLERILQKSDLDVFAGGVALHRNKFFGFTMDFSVIIM
ncbi:MAG: class I SAM-dependent methyltransferase [Bacteroidales bacterium]|jgi:SAM-dependent methyltransferase|nr:class I SAM-dependent methyltransferase [Bacteroidales bacterium]